MERKFGDGKWEIADEGKGRQVQVDQSGDQKNGAKRVTLALNFLTLGEYQWLLFVAHCEQMFSCGFLEGNFERLWTRVKGLMQCEIRAVSD